MKALRAATMFAMLVPAAIFAQGSMTPDAAIRATASAYAAAINKHDAAAVAAFFTVDGDEIIKDGPRIVGRNAIREAANQEFAASPPTLKFSLMVTTMRNLTPDIAIVETTATFSEGPVKTNRGTWFAVRQDGKWLIAALRVFPSAAGK